MSTTTIDTFDTNEEKSFMSEIINDVGSKIVAGFNWISNYFWGVCEATVVVTTAAVDYSVGYLNFMTNSLSAMIRSLAAQAASYFNRAAAVIIEVISEGLRLALVGLIYLIGFVIIFNLLPVLVLGFLVLGALDLIERIYRAFSSEPDVTQTA